MSRFDALPPHEQQLAMRCLEWALSPAAARVDLELAVQLRRRRHEATDDELLLLAYRLVVQGYAKHKRAAGEGGTSAATQGEARPQGEGANRGALPVTREPLVLAAAEILDAELVPKQRKRRRRR